ncbi:RNA-binding protein 43 isoform X1 [Gadus morhua]|uniref:RNA-binding protein 43 isoform X1 n=1 Tax=Gadus morhua TaxID=8049 RepID=UPI0011B3F3C6|nr:uncharacterized protein LOC115535346 isoform X1 [Gadus morhua]XP_030202268.1 uncharacterized protein LOC115535346 isoform X1 [Gadus morhua]
MAVEKRGVGVEVLGVPNLLSNDRTIDKLLIHFLRPRNGGGEVRRVIYPTSVPGQALVIYDEPDDASRVLQKSHHELEFGDRKFPVEVKPVDRPELDLPVEATLNISMIDDKKDLSRLMKMHGLKIISIRGSLVRVEGSMMMLRSFKAETQKMLEAQTYSLTRPSSSSSGQSMSPPGADSRNSTNGSSAQAQQNQWRSSEPRSLDCPSPTPSSSRSSSLSAIGPGDSRQQNHRRSTDPRSLDSPSPTPSSSRSSSLSTIGPGDSRQQNHRRSTDPRSLDSPSPTPSSSRSPSSLPVIGPGDSRHTPPKKPPTETFILSSVVLDYAQRLKKLGMDDILQGHGVEMEAVAMDTDVSGVSVTGWRAQDAAADLRRFLSKLESELHTRQIHLSDLSHEVQVRIGKRIQELKHNYPSVLIRQMGGAVHLIGPRSSCDELKERVMQPRPTEWQPLEYGRRTGRSQEEERSREKERSQERSTTPKRRSQSVPRNRTGRRDELEGEATAKPAPLPSLGGGHSWQRARDHGDQVDQGAARTPEFKGLRGRSNSLTRTIAKPEKTTNHVSPERTNSKPSRGPVIKPCLMSHSTMVKKQFGW